MPDSAPLTVLCLASYEKGQEFLRECKRQGCQVLLLTAEHLAAADWPAEAVDEVFLLPDLSRHEHVLDAVSDLARSRPVARVVPLDEYDVETAAAVREHLRVPGMGETTARYFRDKLAMRMRARDHGIPVPEFTRLVNDAEVQTYAERVPPPWLVKPRFAASAVGIRKIESRDELWPVLEGLGRRRSDHLLERFVTGEIYHVDGIVADQRVVFATASRYVTPPMKVAHEGGIFATSTLERGTPEEERLQALTRELVAALGLVRGVIHAEFVRDRTDEEFRFIEIAARVAGAHIAEVVAAATGINLWAEWARVEVAGEDGSYAVPAPRRDHAGIVISLARQEHPDTSSYTEPEIVWRLDRSHHAGLVVASPDAARVRALLESYARRFYDDFFASLPLPDKPTS